MLTMGQGQSVFDEEQLEMYQECTFFTRKEILKLYRRFSGLNPDKISRQRANVTTRLSISEVMRLTELRENPFSYRVCEVFSTDGRGLHFEDFLDMFSVLSERAPWDLKATYAFRIYDFNDDAAICTSDIKEILSCLTGQLKIPQWSPYVTVPVVESCNLYVHSRPWNVRTFAI